MNHPDQPSPVKQHAAGQYCAQPPLLILPGMSLAAILTSGLLRSCKPVSSECSMDQECMCAGEKRMATMLSAPCEGFPTL